MAAQALRVAALLQGAAGEGSLRQPIRARRLCAFGAAAAGRGRPILRRGVALRAWCSSAGLPPLHCRASSSASSGLSWAPRTAPSRPPDRRSSAPAAPSSGSRAPAVVKVSPEEVSYSITIDAHFRKGDPWGAASWLGHMMDSPTKPNVFSFNTVIAAFARTGRSTDAAAWFEKMEALGLEPNVLTFSALIDGCAKASDPPGAERWFHTMLQYGVTPSAVSFNAVIYSYARVGDVAGVATWMTRMRAAMRPDEITYNCAIHACANARPRAAKEAERLFMEMKAAKLKPTASTLKSLELAVGKDTRDRLCDELRVNVVKAERHRPAPKHRRVEPLKHDDP